MFERGMEEEEEEEGYDRIVVMLDYFNNRVFSGFITVDEAEIIRKAVGIRSSRRTSFDRSSRGELSITFRLKHSFSEDEVRQELNSHFWFDKKSKIGNFDRVRGHVTYPTLSESNDNKNKSLKEIRLEGCNYELTKSQISNWLEVYGVIDSDSSIEEEAIVMNDDEGEAFALGTGTYLIQMTLARLIPNILPIQSKKIRVSYSGVKKQCPHCYSYHRNEQSCKLKKFEDYIKDFKDSNPELSPSMFLYSEDNNIGISSSSVSISNCDDIHGISEGEEDENLEQDNQEDEKDEQDEQDEQETEMETLYTDEDIITLLEDPKNISESERCWLCAQNCETEEEVITKCKEMLKARNDLH